MFFLLLSQDNNMNFVIQPVSKVSSPGLRFDFSFVWLFVRCYITLLSLIKIKNKKIWGSLEVDVRFIFANRNWWKPYNIVINIIDVVKVNENDEMASNSRRKIVKFKTWLSSQTMYTYVVILSVVVIRNLRMGYFIIVGRLTGVSCLCFNLWCLSSQA